MDIETKNTSATGKPALLYLTEYGRLTKQQKLLLKALENANIVAFDRCNDNVNIKMRDLSCLTAVTGKEYSLFSRNDRQFLIVGTERGIHIDNELSQKLILSGYKWTGHTHVGFTDFCLMPSEADYETLSRFKQKRSVIYNSVGKFYVFEKEE